MCQEKLNTLYRLVKFINKSDADLVFIGGDVFDTSNPPEALKAEFCKIINSIKKHVIIITGRPGDHDYVSENNYVLMDLKEAYNMDSRIHIVGKNVYEDDELPNVLFCHLMLEGIDERYRKTVSLSDPMFKKYNTILLGDYHAFYHKKFGRKDFVYSGAPYPTRYGENCHSVCMVEIDDKTGKLIDVKKLNLKTYKLLELYTTKLVPDIDFTFVVKYKLKVKPKNLAETIREMEGLKEEIFEIRSGCMDVIWELSTVGENNVEVQTSSESLIDVCEDYILANGGEHSGKLNKEFKKLYKEFA